MPSVQPSASTAATGLGLRTVGDYAYALSGTHGSSDSEVSHLKFHLSNGIFVGRITCNGALKISDPNVGRTSIFQVSFNGEVVALMKTDAVEEDQPSTVYNDIIIPPGTEVEVTVRSDAATADRLTSVIMTGRIYGAE